jgi:membrane dipeptidase
MTSSHGPDRRLVLGGIAAVGLTPAIAAAGENDEALHRRLLVLDSHVDVVLPGSPPRAYASDGGTQSDLAKLQAGGVDALVYAVAVSTGPRTPEGYAAGLAEAQRKVVEINLIAERSQGRIVIVRGADELRRAVAAGRIAILPGFLNAYSLGEDFSRFDLFHRSGVRVAGLAHAGNTVFADSSRPGAAGEEHGGLSSLGKAAVARLNDLGVLVDVSQLTPKGVQQTVALSRSPVVATHSAARALADHPRNLSDAELDLIAAKGGVVQVTAFNSYLLPAPADYAERLKALRTRFGLDPAGSGYQGADTLPQDRSDAFFAGFRALVPQATVTTYVDHIDYIAKRIGVEHVGVGSDFNHGAGIEGFQDESQAPAVTRELLARGYGEAQLGLIWGGNFLRVLEAAERSQA